MSFQALLSALDRYIEVKKSMEAEGMSGCRDWDCGMANELSGGFSSPGDYDRLVRARANLEAALNRYIDERVRSALEAL